MDTRLAKIKGDLIGQMIEVQGLKRWWVAEVSGIHPTTLRRWLRGKNEKVQLVKLQRLSQVLEVSLSELID